MYSLFIIRTVFYIMHIYTYIAILYGKEEGERTHIFLEGLFTYLLAHCYGFWLDLPLMQQTAVKLLKAERCFPFFGTSCSVA